MSYKNCTEAYADKVYNIPESHEYYTEALDGTGTGEPDGIACENPPTTAGFTNLAAVAQTKSPDPSTTASPSTTSTVQAVPAPELPVTGSNGTTTLMILALLFLVFGVAFLFIGQKVQPYLGRHR